MKIIAYASSTRPNHLWSAAQYNNALPKNRTEADIPLVSLASHTSALAEKDARIAELEAALRPFAGVADFMDSETEGFSMTDTLHLVSNDDQFPDTLIETFCLQRFYTARSALAKEPTP